jgi:hypothetical protein
MNTEAGFFGDAVMIHSYSRAEAIDDGLLIDVTAQAKLAGFKIPVAVSAAVWAECVEWSHHTSRIKRVEQSEDKRLAALLRVAASTASAFARSGNDSPVVVFGFNRVPRTGPIRSAALMHVKCVIGPGDTLAPVVTILLPDED